MAVAAPAHRAPITIASYIVCLICDPNRRWRPCHQPKSSGSRRSAARSCATSRSRTPTRCWPRRSRQRSGQGANWCTFATWASRQAGATIRGEDALDLLTDRLGAAARCCTRCGRSGAGCCGAGCFDRDVAARAAHRPAAHAVRRGRAGVATRSRAATARSSRRSATSSRAGSEADDPRRVPRGPARRRPAGRPAATARRVHPLLRRRARAAGSCSAGQPARSACTSRRGCSRRSARRSTRPYITAEELGRGACCPDRAVRAIQRGRGARRAGPGPARRARRAR